MEQERGYAEFQFAHGTRGKSLLLIPRSVRRIIIPTDPYTDLLSVPTRARLVADIQYQRMWASDREAAAFRLPLE